MKSRKKSLLLIGLSAVTTCAFAAAFVSCAKAVGKSPEYEYRYFEPLHAESDAFMKIDGKLDEEVWQGQNYLYWCGSESQCEVKATTVFTSKGLYLGLFANDTGVRWSNRYAVGENSGFEIQIVKADEKNYNDNVNYVHPSQSFMFNIDAKNALSRSERRFDAAGYCKGELNGETEYISAELFLPWSEMNYKAEEFNEDGTPDAVKIYVRYTGISYGMAGFSDYNQFETYYTYTKDGSTCSLDRNSKTDTVGYSVNGWTPGDRWEIDQENKIAENKVTRTQMLWFRKDVNGAEKSGGTHYLAGVKVKAINDRSPFVGFITLRDKVTFNIFGINTNDLVAKNKVLVSSGKKTNGMRSVWDSHFSYEYKASGYEGETVKDLYGNDLTLGRDEVYLSVAKRGSELFYFVNGKYVGTEYDVRVEGKCTAGIFANGRTVVSDWSFEDFSDSPEKLDDYLNGYVWFVTEEDDSSGFVLFDKTIVPHGESVNVSVMPKAGYILSSLKINKEDRLEDFLNNADKETSSITLTPESDINVVVGFSVLPKEICVSVYLEPVGDDGSIPSNANYVIRDKNGDVRFTYTGTLNSNHLIDVSLVKGGTYTINEKELKVSGKYEITITSTEYNEYKGTIVLPESFDGTELKQSVTLESYPYGSVTVNGKTVAAKGSGFYKYNQKGDNRFTSDDSFRYFNVKYLKNTVFDGNYIFNANVSLTADANTADGRIGSIVGYAVASGGRYIEMKTAAWISDKLYLNLNSECEIGLSGFPATNADGSNDFTKAGAKKQFTVARYNDVIYVTNKDGVLCFTLSRAGITLYYSTIVEGGARFETFNKGASNFFKDGSENAFALYNFRSNEGGGAYCYEYSFEKSPEDLSGVLKTFEVCLKDGEGYKLNVSGTTVDAVAGYVCGAPVSLLFTNVAKQYNYYVLVEYDDETSDRLLGAYDKEKGEYALTLSLKSNATVSLVPYELGEASANGESLTTPRGNALEKTAEGTYRNEYEQTGDILQYLPEAKATGDFTMNASVMVVNKYPERIDAGRVGSGVGFVISMGADKELVIFSNKVQQDKLIFMINTKRASKQITATGFKNVNNHLGVLGSGIRFTVRRIGNTLEIYNKNGVKQITVGADGKITCAAGVTLTGDTAALEAHFGEMLSAGNETAFGIYREFNYRGEYEWNVSFDSKVNGENVSAGRGVALEKTAEGTYRSEYEQTEDTLQYLPSQKKTGDYTLTASVTVVGKAPERLEASRVGSGVGFVISMGAGKELVIFSNKVQQDKLIFMINTPRGGKQFTATGFKNVNNHLGELGAGIRFTVKRVGNTLEIYDKDGKKGITFGEDGTITCEAGFGFEQSDTAALKAHVGEMLSAGNETAFGIYREFNYKGEYQWKLSFAENESN